MFGTTLACENALLEQPAGPADCLSSPEGGWGGSQAAVCLGTNVGAWVRRSGAYDRHV